MLLVLAAGCCMMLVAAALLLLFINSQSETAPDTKPDGRPVEPEPDVPEPEPDGPEPQPKPGKPEPEPQPKPGGGGTCDSLFCTTGAVKSGGTYSVGTRPRMQFQRGEDGYCGECSIQVTMTKYGVWLPQETVRMEATGSAKGDVLVETNSYPTAFSKLKINAEQFQGSGYQAYMEWVKERLVKGLQCIIVYNFGGSGYDDYGHIVPVTGIKTSNPSGGYDADDTLIVHTHFTKDTVEKKVGSYQCKGGGMPGLESGGCVPNKSLQGWAWCIKGPKYLGIGPLVELLMDKNTEGGDMGATVVLHGLTSGKSYKVYQFTSAGSVPSSPSAKPTGTPWKTVTAAGTTHKITTSFPSRTPRWFVAVEG